MAEEELMEEEDVVISDLLEQILQFALEEAKERLAEDGELAPFTATVVRDVVYFDSILGEDADELYAAAEEFIAGLDGFTGYALCYDGYMEEEENSAIIVEGGLPGEPVAVAVGSPYTVDDAGNYTFVDEVLFLGDAPNYAEKLNPADDWDPEEE